MNLILKGRGVELNDRLRGYATEKLTRVQRFFDRIIKMEVELLQDGHRGDTHRVEVTVKTPRETLVAHGVGGDFFAAIDQASDRLETQVKKVKERLSSHPHRNQAAPAMFVADDFEQTPEIIRVEPLLAKPVTPEEAILELDERGLQFLVFTDAESMKVAVLYRRDDGNFGLIEHEGKA